MKTIPSHRRRGNKKRAATKNNFSPANNKLRKNALSWTDKGKRR